LEPLAQVNSTVSQISEEISGYIHDLLFSRICPKLTGILCICTYIQYNKKLIRHFNRYESTIADIKYETFSERVYVPGNKISR
jgi:predicted ferric reductase